MEQVPGSNEAFASAPGHTDPVVLCNEVVSFAKVLARRAGRLLYYLGPVPVLF